MQQKLMVDMVLHVIPEKTADQDVIPKPCPPDQVGSISQPLNSKVQIRALKLTNEDHRGTTL